MENNVAERDRRVADRANVSWVFRGHSASQSISGVITNLSSLGCLAVMSSRVAQNQKLSLRIMAKTDMGGKDISTTTVIKRVMVKDGKCFVGMQFLDIPATSKSFIASHVKELLAAEEKKKSGRMDGDELAEHLYINPYLLP